MSGREPARRSVTIRPDLNTRIRDFVAAGMRHGIDLDYTTALNLFAELGQKWLEGATHMEREKLRNIWESYLDYDRLEKEGVTGDWREYEEFRQWKLMKANLDSDGGKSAISSKPKSKPSSEKV